MSRYLSMPRLLSAVVLALVLGLLAPPATHSAEGAGTDDTNSVSAAATAQLVGQVLGEEGFPLQNVLVQAFSVDDLAGDPVASALSYEVDWIDEEDGTEFDRGGFRLHVPPGQYKVRFSKDPSSRFSPRILTAWYGGDSGDVLEVGDAQVLRLDPFQAVTDRTVITGTVVDQTGAPLDGVKVEALAVTEAGDPTTTVMASAITYADGARAHGAYRLHVPPGDYRVRFSSVPRTPSLQTVFHGGGAGTVVHAAPQDQVDLPPVTMIRNGSTVSGLVTDAQDRPVDGITVQALDAGDRSTVLASDLTYEVKDLGEHGAYRLRLPAGSYVLRVTSGPRGPQYGTTWFGGSSAATAEIVTVGVEQDLTLPPIALPDASWGTITGRVLTPAGQPAAGVSARAVQRTRWGGTRTRERTVTDARGVFTLRRVKRTAPHLVVLDGTDAKVGGTLTVGRDGTPAGEPIVIGDGDPVDLGPLTLPPGVTVRGTVSTTDGGPVSWTWASLYRRTEGGWFEYAGQYYAGDDYSSDATPGSYEFRHVSPGTYTVMVGGSGIRAEYLGNKSRLRNAQTFEVADADVTIPDEVRERYRASVLTGVVRDESGEPVGGATVRLRRCGTTTLPNEKCSKTRRVVQTLDDGTYTMTVRWRRDARYVLAAEVPGSATAWFGGPDKAGATRFQVNRATGQENQRRDFSVLPADGTATGLVPGSVDPDSYRYAYAELLRWDEDGEYFRSEGWAYTSGRRFAFALPQDRSGRWTVRLQVEQPGWPSLALWPDGAPEPGGPDAPGTFVLPEGTGSTSLPPFQLPQLREIDGATSGEGGAGLPAGNVYVHAHTWGPWGLEELGEQLNVGTDGSWTWRVPVDTPVVFQASTWLSTFDDAWSGGLTGAPTSWEEFETAAEATRTADPVELVLPTRWGDVGAVAGLRDPLCRRQTSYGDRLRFAGTDLTVSSAGYILGSGRTWNLRWNRILSARGRRAALAPAVGLGYWGAETTYGLSDDGDTLCVQWTAENHWDDSYGGAVQAWLRLKDDGRVAVEYRYDRIAGTEVSHAGWSEGTGVAGTLRRLPRDPERGYADDSPTALVRSGDAAAPGLVQFDFGGFLPPEPKPAVYRARAVTPPALAGAPVVGSTLTVSDGTWTVNGAVRDDLTVMHQWYVGNRRRSQEGSYTPTAEDAGKRLWVRSRASAPGVRTGYSSTSLRRVFLSGSAAVNTVPPSTSPDVVRVGDSVTGDPGTWEWEEGVDPAYRFRWLRDGIVIRGELGTTYTTTSADYGHEIRFQVTPADRRYASAGAVSVPIVFAEPEPLAWETAPTLDGEAKVGSVLRVVPGTWPSSLGEDPAVSYRWIVGGETRTPDPGGDGSVYTVRTNDAGEQVSVVVTASKPGHLDARRVLNAGKALGPDSRRATLSGVARTSFGTPVTEARWIACTSDFECLPGGRTDDAGAFASSLAVVGGDYTVTVSAPSGSQLRDGSTRVVLPAEGADVAVLLGQQPTPPPNVEIEGSIGTDAGRPVVTMGELVLGITGCGDVASPQYTISYPGTTRVQQGVLTRGPVGEDGLATYSTTIPGFRNTGEATIATNIPADCEAGTEPTSVIVYIDPSGIVTDQFGRTVVATTTLLRSDVLAGPFTTVEDGDVSVMDPDVNVRNPFTTDEDGFFRWDVTEGFYRVRAASAGCSDATTPTMEVPPPRLGLLIKLECSVDAPSLEPAIVGSPRVGETVSLAALDELLVAEDIEWVVDDEVVGTGAEYQVRPADAGREVRVRVTVARASFVQEFGKGETVDFTSYSGTSEALTVLAGDAPTATTPPAITGTPKTGETLTATNGEWNSPGLTFTRQWRRQGTPITGATTTTYQVTPDDVGKQLTVVVTATKTGYHDGTATTNAVTPTLGDAPTATTPPAITGTPKVGLTLTATNGTWSLGEVSHAYQWLRNGSEIPGATAATYKAVFADAATTLSVRVSTKRAGYADGQATSVGRAVPKVASTTAIAAPKKVTAGKLATVRVTVKATGTTPTGKVRVLVGKKAVKTVALKAGTATVKLKLAAAKAKSKKHKVSAVYLGTTQVSGSTSRTVVVTAVPKR